MHKRVGSLLASAVGRVAQERQARQPSMLFLSLYQIPSSSPFYSSNPNGIFHPHLLKSPFLSPLTTTTTTLTLHVHVRPPHTSRAGLAVGPTITSSLGGPLLLWAGRLCIFYALLRTGLAGSPSNPFNPSPELGGGADLGFSKWIESFQGKSAEKEASDRRKLVSKWHPTTKGTLKRSYRVPSKAEGRRLLKAIASLLSDDDHFVDATSHKGCQIRRENAHGESVCCNNVRALFDELPTPHLVVEITAFPAGPLTDKDYVKAEKLERVLRSGSSI